MNKRVNIGIIGLGDHCSQSHVKYLLEMKDICQIGAVCDLQREKYQELVDKMGAGDAFKLYYHTTAEELLQNEEVEAVFIMTPDRFHTEQLVAAVKAGKHVFCEKPLATTIEEYEQLVKAFTLAEEKNLVVTTCHPRRFDTPFEALKAMQSETIWEDEDTVLMSGTFKTGKVLHFDFNFQYHKPSKSGLHTSLMFDHLNHEVDAMHYLFGLCDIKHATKNFDSETQFHVSGARKDGITFSFFGQRKLDASIYPEYLRILCEKGSIYMDLYAGEMTVVSENGSKTSYLNPSLYKTDYTKRFHAINKNFLESILGKTASYISHNEMLINTKLAIDLHEKTYVEYGFIT